MEEFFHVHTRRCKHGSEETDEILVKKAISLGAKRITFTDHVPFPENPFGNRMDFEELEEYLDSLEKLKKLYTTQIDIKIGFEVEYLPKYLDYFWFLKNHPKVDLLILWTRESVKMRSVAEHFHTKPPAMRVEDKNL